MCERGPLVQRLSLGSGLSLSVYHDPNAGQWTAEADVPTPIGMVQISAKAREDVVTAAMRAARELWCRVLGIGCNTDGTDAFLSGADDAPSFAHVARAKVTETVTRVARAASLLHRARMGDPSARAGVQHVVSAAKAGDARALAAWKTMQTIAGLAQVARSFVPQEVSDAAYSAMVSGYRARPTLDMIAGPDGSYRLRRRADGSPSFASGADFPRAHGGGSLVTMGGRYGLAMRW